MLSEIFSGVLQMYLNCKKSIKAVGAITLPVDTFVH
jgi:hypothetical protein